MIQYLPTSHGGQTGEYTLLPRMAVLLLCNISEKRTWKNEIKQMHMTIWNEIMCMEMFPCNTLGLFFFPPVVRDLYWMLESGFEWRLVFLCFDEWIQKQPLKLWRETGLIECDHWSRNLA